MDKRKRKFITNNVYNGEWNEQYNCMDGFGVYEMQNGVVYRGYFQRGLMHGCGVWEFDLPIDYKIVTTCNKGKIETIHKVIYADGIRFDNGELRNFDFTNWDYCTATDRRFSEEVLRGLLATGIETPVALELKPGQYGITGEIYHKSSGFKVKAKPEYPEATFVACIAESEWIKQNCPRGLKPGEHRVLSKTLEKNILKNNVQFNEEFMKNLTTNADCSCEGVKMI